MHNRYRVRGLPSSSTGSGCLDNCRTNRNVCYANSTFQVLVSLPDIRFYCLSNNDFPYTDAGRLKARFSHFVRAYLGTGDTVEGKRLLCRRHVELMEQIYNMDPELYPRDGTASSLELLQLLIRSLGRDVEPLFHSTWSAQVTAIKQDGNCARAAESNTETTHMIQLPIIDAGGRRLRTLEECIEAYRLELVDYDYADPDLDIPGTNKGFRQITYLQLSKYLIIQLSRSNELGEYAYKHLVRLPEFADFGLLLGMGRSEVYHLNDRINYDGGHYIADVYVNLGDDARDAPPHFSWVTLNDCTKTSERGRRLPLERRGMVGLVYIYKRLSRREQARYATRDAGVPFVAEIDQERQYDELPRGSRDLLGYSRFAKLHYETERAPPPPAPGGPVAPAVPPTGPTTASTGPTTGSTSGHKSKEKHPIPSKPGEGGCRRTDCFYDPRYDFVDEGCIFDPEPSRRSCYKLTDVAEKQKEKYPGAKLNERIAQRKTFLRDLRFIDNFEKFTEVVGNLSPTGTVVDDPVSESTVDL